MLAAVDRSRQRGLEVDADVQLRDEQGPATDRLTPDLKAGVYRTVQEALTNAKHGSAGRAVVQVVQTEDRVSVVVPDDGAGFEPAIADSGVGLVGMRERTELLRRWRATGRPHSSNCGKAHAPSVGSAA